MMKVNCHWIANNLDGSIISQSSGVSFDALNRKYLSSINILYRSIKVLDLSLAKSSVVVYRKRTFIYGEVYKVIHLVYYKNDAVSIYLIDDETGRVKKYNQFGQDERLYKIEFTTKDLVKVGI